MFSRREKHWNIYHRININFFDRIRWRYGWEWTDFRRIIHRCVIRCHDDKSMLKQRKDLFVVNSNRINVKWRNSKTDDLFELKFSIDESNFSSTKKIFSFVDENVQWMIFSLLTWRLLLKIKASLSLLQIHLNQVDRIRHEL